MKFAVIGLGSFGIKRAQSIKNSKKAELVAIYDTNSEIAEKGKIKLNVPILEYNKILKDKSIDVLCICVPNKYHKEIIIATNELVQAKLLEETCFLRKTYF